LTVLAATLKPHINEHNCQTKSQSQTTVINLK